MSDCPFCLFNSDNLVAEGKYVFVLRDRFPVTAMHCLVIPKKHRVDFFALDDKERKESFEIIEMLRAKFLKEDPSITGFNIGMNCGASAGQTVFHCHIHLIPRRNGDMADPKGGVRGVIPSEQKY